MTRHFERGNSRRENKTTTARLQRTPPTKPVITPCPMWCSLTGPPAALTRVPTIEQIANTAKNVTTAAKKITMILKPARSVLSCCGWLVRFSLFWLGSLGIFVFYHREMPLIAINGQDNLRRVYRDMLRLRCCPLTESGVSTPGRGGCIVLRAVAKSLRCSFLQISDSLGR